MENPPPYSKYTPPGHKTIQSNNNPAGRGYFASGYPIDNNYGRSSSDSLTNFLPTGNLRLYNAIRHNPLYSGGYRGSSVHNHYYNNQGTDPKAAQTEAQTIPSNQNMNADQTSPSPTLAAHDEITDLDCVYAMKILNCSVAIECPQEWLHPSCFYRTIATEYYDSIILPPPPPTEIHPEINTNTQRNDFSSSDDLTTIDQNENRDENLDSSNEQAPVVSSSISSSKAVATLRRTGHQKAK